MSHHSLVHALQQLASRARPPRPWRDGRKIPWHDPEFSRRVLAVHLDPDTNMASRNPDVIAEHVAWLRELISAEPLPSDRPCHILDLGCGPGLYALPLARAGFRVTGLDFGPAVVAYGQQLLRDAGLDDLATIIQADLTDLPDALLTSLPPVDVVTFWFAEIASFTRDEAQRVLQSAARVLREDGLLVLETMPWDLFVQNDETSWEMHERSVFSDTPHLWLQEHAWDNTAGAEITVHWILDAATGHLDRFAQCHQAYRDDELRDLLASAGFNAIETHPPITGVDENLEFPVVVARRMG